MKTRTRKPVQENEDLSPFFEEEETLDLEALSEEELEDLLFEEETGDTRKGPLNLPTMAGLSLILVGVAYIFQQMGLWGNLNLAPLIQMLPWIAGILIILLGFGVLSWSPDKRRKKAKAAARKARKEARARGEKKSSRKDRTTTTSAPRHRLTKTRDKKLAGVCGGIAEYFNLDPTLVRIAFVIGTIASSGVFPIAYIILAMIMPNPDKPTRLSQEERIKIIRDS